MATAFYLPAARGCAFDFPVPLDDVFIHFDFARATARGHPLEWIAGQGYSSGETSPLYALLLAVAWGVGFRGGALAVAAACIACASIVWAMRSLRVLLGGARQAVAYVAAAMLVSIGALDFTLVSGMEFALFIALLFRAFVSADRVMRAPPHVRAHAQWRLGALGALLVWTRPEAAVVIAVLSVLAARHARSLSPIASMVRVALPGAVATLLVATLNRIMTGDWASAGARLKLLSSNPYLTDLDRAREVVLNVFYFGWKVVEGSAVARPSFVWVLLACALAPLVSRRSRDLSAAVLVSAGLYGILVSFNGAARFQGFRYYAPAVAMFVCAMALGLGAVARRFGALASVILGVFIAGGAVSRLGAQVRFFRDASENVHDQQVVVGKKLHEMVHPGDRILLNDAGAIVYFADVGAMDALGLGGFRRLPFTRAALSGEASVVELLQRLPSGDRPSVLALYPNWFPEITSRFGHEVARVTIEHNVICGGPTKVIALADWSALDGDEDPPGAIDGLDVADVESEKDHDYVSPAPNGGYAIVDVLPGASGAPLFDGGRIVPTDERESFRSRGSARHATLVVRSDDVIDAYVDIGGNTYELSAPKRTSWTTAQTSAFAVDKDERIVIRAKRPLRDFHVWVVSD